MRTIRRLLVLIAAAVLVPAGSASAFSFEFAGDSAAQALTAAAAEEPLPAQPLTGEGEGMELVANLPLSRGASGTGVAASDIELHGRYAFIGSYTEGMVIADISNPYKPERVATFACGGGSQYDVQLHPELKFAVLSTDSKNATCFPRTAAGATQEGSMIIDLSDITKPTLVAAIPMPVGSHTQTLDGDLLYINNYPTAYHKLEIFDLSDPANPEKLSQLDFGDGQDSVHDLITDHRPDGKVLVYAASIKATDVIDVTDPKAPVLLQRINDPLVSISHQAEPNFERDTLIVTDEYSGGAAPTPNRCGRAPMGAEPLPDNQERAYINTGALHFYKLDAAGTIAANGTGSGKYGTFNLPADETIGNEGGCTVHVFWQAPDENRLVAAWYGRGIRIVDFEDPAAATQEAYFIPDGADTWAAKPHCGFIFTGDINRGMDVLTFEGDGWPRTAGPMESQRAVYQGNHGAPVAGECAEPAAVTPAEPADLPADEDGHGTGGQDYEEPGSAEPERAQANGSAENVALAAPPKAVKRRPGGAKWAARFTVPGRPGSSRRLSVTFVDDQQAVATKLVFRARAGQTRRLRGLLAGAPGRYRFVVRLGADGPPLYRGRVTIKKGSKSALRLRPGQSLVCRIV